MKISCDIIRDLLPLYKDSVCSSATKDMVEDHLSGCEGCREYYEQMSGELPQIASGEEGSSQIASGEEGSSQIAEDWSFFKKTGQQLIYRQILFASAAVLLLLIPYSIYSVFSSSPSPLIDAAREKVLEAVPFLDRRIPVEDIEVHDAYQLEDGSVCVTFSVHSYISSFESTYILTDQGDGPALDFSSWGDSNGLSLKKYWSDFHQADTVSTLCFVLPAEPSVYRGDPAEELEPVTISSGGAYFVGKGGKILPLYEEGDAIATAPADIQTQVEEQAAIAYADTPGSLEGGTEVIDHSFFYFLSLNGEK